MKFDVTQDIVTVWFQSYESLLRLTFSLAFL